MNPFDPFDPFGNFYTVPRELVIEKLDVPVELARKMKFEPRKPGETLTAWADRLRNNPSPQATDAE